MTDTTTIGALIKERDRLREALEQIRKVVARGRPLPSIEACAILTDRQTVVLSIAREALERD